MRISSRIDGSICGAIFSNRSYGSSTRTAPGSLHKLYNGIPFVASESPQQRHNISRSTESNFRYGTAIDVPGASRPFTSITSHPQRRHLSQPSYFTSHSPLGSSRKHSAFADAAVEHRPYRPSKEEFLSYVDKPGEETVEEHFNQASDPYMRRYAPSDGPHLTISDVEEDGNFPTVKWTEGGNQSGMEPLNRIRYAVIMGLRRPQEADFDAIYEEYRKLPEPRMHMIDARLRHHMLRLFGSKCGRSSASMMRYFSVVADVKNSGLALNRSEWNMAVSLAARYVAKSTDVELEATLHLWREMERDAGIKASDVTFNILFDVATKAEKFTLAEMIYQEMTNRGFRYGRYHHVTLIYFFGLKMDSDGVRAAYREMVEAGEMIDTVVLNCVIASFLRCGDEADALRVYERMKSNDHRTQAMPDRNYAAQKMVTQVLAMFSSLSRHFPDLRPGFEEATPQVPNLRTYQLLIDHYGLKLGDMGMTAKFLDEMKWFQVSVHGTIFLKLFKGFHIHGNSSTSDWSEKRLESVWSAFLDAFDSGADGLYISTWLAVAVLEAFMKFSRPERVIEAYDLLSARWTLNDQEEDFMMTFLTRLLNNQKARDAKTSVFENVKNIWSI